MKVADILRIKGSVVKTVAPHETALLLSGHLRAEQIGALVVLIPSMASYRSATSPMASRRTAPGYQRFPSQN